MRKKAKLTPRLRRCMNCAEAFVPLFHEIRISLTSNPLKVKDVIYSLYRLDHLDNFSHHDDDDDESASICASCSENLGVLYKTWVKFNQLRSLDSDLTEKLKRMDDLLESFQQQQQPSCISRTENNQHSLFDDSHSIIKSEIDIGPLEMIPNPVEQGVGFCNDAISYDQDNTTNVFNFEADQDEEEEDNGEEFIISTDPLNLNFANSSQNLNYSQPIFHNNDHNFNHNSSANNKNNKRRGRMFKIETIPIVVSIACDVCQKTFSSKKELQIHDATHRNKDPVVCTFCDESFIEQFMLYSHHRIHGLETPFNCPYCPDNFVAKEDLLDHLKNKRLKSPSKKFDVFLCAVCARSFRTNHELSKHTADHCTRYDKCLASKKFTCALCQRALKTEAQWLSHLGTHGEFSCTICEKSFAGQAYFLDHENKRLINLTKAQQEDPLGFASSLTCRVPGCSVPFCYLTKLKKHEDEDHPEKPFACANCDRRFSIEFNLTSHKKACIGSGQSKCPLNPNCDKKDVIFDTPAAIREHLLESHVNVVEDNRAVGKCRIGCPLCPKTFMSMANIKLHMMGHTGEWKRNHHAYATAASVQVGDGEGPRPKGRRKVSQECGLCGKKFRNTTLLRCHMKSHRGDGLDLKCPECGRIFVTEAGFRSHHMMTHTERFNHHCPHPNCEKIFRQRKKLNQHFDLTGHGPAPPGTRNSSIEQVEEVKDDEKSEMLVVIKQEDSNLDDDAGDGEMA